MESLYKDLRYGARVLIAKPGFTGVALLALALGIGATSAIFSVVNAVLLRPLPYRAPDRLVMLWQNHEARGGPATEWASPPNFADWRDRSQSFDHVAALRFWGPTLTGREEAEQIVGAAVSYDMFSALGVEPAVGRAFRPEDDQPGAERVVVVGHDVWLSHFGGDRALVGKSLTLGGDPYTVIGIMPVGFKFPIIGDAQLWRPLAPALVTGCGRGCVVLRVIARLKPGVTLAAARSEMTAIADRLADEYPAANKGIGATVVPLQEQLVGKVRPALLVLLGAVGLVLLIACANVANLMLARAALREKEIALRTALGASRRRLIRQLLTESVLLSFGGGVLGVLLGFRMVDVLKSLAPAGTPRLDEAHMDARVLGFTLVLAVLTGLTFGLAPALHATKSDPNQSMKEGGRGTGSGPGGRRIRGGLVVSEVALALMLSIGAGLLMRSFAALQHAEPGFNPAGVLTMQLGLPPSRYPDRRQISGFYALLIDRVRALPGVVSADAVSSLPMSGDNTDTSFIIEGRPQPPPDQEPAAWYSSVTPGYFRTMGIHLLKGREFTERDIEGAPGVIVISEALARRHFPGEDPIGKRLGFGRGDWREIVGVTADVRHFGLQADARPSMYFAQAGSPERVMSLVVRAASDPAALTGAVRGEVRAMDKDLATRRTKTMEQVVSASIAEPRFLLLLLATFATLALVLASFGIYGVMSYSVTQRTHEIGIRIALGANRGSVLKMVVGQGLFLTFIGIALGIAAALALSWIMTRLLFGVSPTDAGTFTGVSLLLALVALMASYIPARRATRVDPMVALRYE